MSKSPLKELLKYFHKWRCDREKGALCCKAPFSAVVFPFPIGKECGNKRQNAQEIALEKTFANFFACEQSY